MAILTTERLTLRPASKNDLDGFHAILSDPRATSYWSTPPHASVDQTQAWLASMLEIPDGEGEDFVIEYEGRMIGKAGFFRFPEIGFILHPEAWGKGFAREALAAVLARGFEVHRIDAVEADVDPRNAASLNVLGKLGFVETGRESRTYRIGDEWCDSVYLKLSRPR
ncbi:GNAT family N-acetyltransferase [Pseudoblastomonas halimionae]|uniref:GNAT family N-acetyltransferase n=1 Tax=Alteriqipengyuania halimionae TaxID=1926630 RepID=A0A6I4U8Q8_9SPHN|nr:GNAT family N-acetyltransferase [Alteriqipengyuania halimionae]MXP10721.1 GNAT family N-acetyltransferase [Alteriqipengyuania halimionae]